MFGSMVEFQSISTRKTERELLNGAYYRCFGNVEVARIPRSVQSPVIANGHELEGLIEELAKDCRICDIDDFPSIQIIPSGVFTVFKPEIRKSKILEGHGIEPDFIVFKRSQSSQSCYIVELKDGHEFDTKSSQKEHQNLQTFLSRNALAFQYFYSYCKICGFNAESKSEIVKGCKNKIASDQAMTGRELFEMLELDYDAALARRAKDREDNLEHLINSLLALEVVGNRIG